MFISLCWNTAFVTSPSNHILHHTSHFTHLLREGATTSATPPSFFKNIFHYLLSLILLNCCWFGDEHSNLGIYLSNLSIFSFCYSFVIFISRVLGKWSRPWDGPFTWTQNTICSWFLQQWFDYYNKVLIFWFIYKRDLIWYYWITTHTHW